MGGCGQPLTILRQKAVVGEAALGDTEAAEVKAPVGASLREPNSENQLGKGGVEVTREAGDGLVQWSGSQSSRDFGRQDGVVRSRSSGDWHGPEALGPVGRGSSSRLPGRW